MIVCNVVLSYQKILVISQKMSQSDQKMVSTKSKHLVFDLKELN